MVYKSNHLLQLTSHENVKNGKENGFEVEGKICAEGKKRNCMYKFLKCTLFCWPKDCKRRNNIESRIVSYFRMTHFLYKNKTKPEETLHLVTFHTEIMKRGADDVKV